jgi:MYXO-CTERM domain-containing protein
LDATGSWNSVDLEGIAPYDGDVYLGSPGSITVGGVDFITSSPESNSWVTGNTYYSEWSAFSSSGAPDGTNGTTMDIPESTSFGLYLGSFNPADPIYVTLSNGADTEISGYDLNSEFVGFTDTVPFDWVNFTQYNGTGLQVGPVSYGSIANVSTVPGPAGLVPFAVGLLALRRRRA